MEDEFRLPHPVYPGVGTALNEAVFCDTELQPYFKAAPVATAGPWKRGEPFLQVADLWRRFCWRALCVTVSRRSCPTRTTTNPGPASRAGHVRPRATQERTQDKGGTGSHLPGAGNPHSVVQV